MHHGAQASLHPLNGVRFVLERFDGDRGGVDDPAGGAVRYRVALYTPNERFEADASVDLTAGEVSFEGWYPSAPPEPLVATTRAFLRSEYKARRDAPSPWPDRLTRWRAT